MKVALPPWNARYHICMGNATKRAPTWLQYTIAAALVLVFVVYPLSLGPTVWLWRAAGNPRGWAAPIETFYRPIIWLRDEIPFFGRCYAWYLDLWV